MNHKITIYSTALFSTWINVEELNLLIDAGDGLSAGLMQKSRKIKHVFVTHPDRDHLNGLPQFIQLNSRPDFPVIYFPKDSSSFPFMQEYLKNFDPHVKGSKWISLVDGLVIGIKKGYEIEAIRNEHVKVPIGIHKSLSYKLYQTKNKLKKEFVNLSPDELKKIAVDKGREFLTEVHKKNIISFSGDTPVDNYSKWEDSELLIHESTFLRKESDSKEELRGHKHSTAEEVMRMVKEINIKSLILNHFSSRYSKEEINMKILELIKEMGIDIPVRLVYPGEIARDILSSKPINE